MSEQKPEIDNDDDFFNLHLNAEESSNKRTAVRYIRTDIVVSVDLKGIFNFNRSIDATLLDISSKGAAIKCEKKLATKKEIDLKLVFDDGKEFIISAKIVHKKNKVYGIKFNRYNDELGDYLMSSEHDLIFK